MKLTRNTNHENDWWKDVGTWKPAHVCKGLLSLLLLHFLGTSTALFAVWVMCITLSCIDHIVAIYSACRGTVGLSRVKNKKLVGSLSSLCWQWICARAGFPTVGQRKQSSVHQLWEAEVPRHNREGGQNEENNEGEDEDEENGGISDHFFWNYNQQMRRRCFL